MISVMNVIAMILKFSKPISTHVMRRLPIAIGRATGIKHALHFIQVNKNHYHGGTEDTEKIADDEMLA